MGLPPRSCSFTCSPAVATPSHTSTILQAAVNPGDEE